jgi:hypothetical protein
MSRKNIKKNIKLSLDFDTFVSTHPRTLRKVPSGAHIIFVSKKDAGLTRENLEIARSSRAGRFVIACKDNVGWKIDSYPPKNKVR